MSTTVLAPSGFEISSNHEDADSMIGSLAPDKAEAKTPRVLVNKGEKVQPEEKDETSQAASVLGKKGGDAAAEARRLKAKAGAKDPKGASVDLDEAAIKAGKERQARAGKAEETADDKDEAEAAAAAKKGNPRHDPEARIAVINREKREALDRADRAERELEQERRTRTAPAAERKPAPVAAQATDDPEPDLASYDGPDAYERFVKDSGRWAARDENRKMEHTRAGHAREVQRAQRIDGAINSFNDRLVKAHEADENFLERTAEISKQMQPSFTLPKDERGRPVGVTGLHVATDLVIQSPHVAPLMDYFAANPSEFQRIAALGTRDEVIAEMAIASHLSRSDAVTADTSSEREVSRAGSPVRSVTGSPHAAEPDLSAPQSFDAHMAKKSRASK